MTEGEGRRPPIYSLLPVVSLGSFLLLSCASTLNPCTGDPARDLTHEDPHCVIDAAVRAAEEKRHDLFPQLLKNLRHSDDAVRFFTGIALRKLTGFDAGYRAYGSSAEQEEAISRWDEWWKAREEEKEDPENLAETERPGQD